MNKRYLAVLIAATLATICGRALAGVVDENFDAFTVGDTFTNGSSQWQSSSSAVMVTNANPYSLPNAVVLPGAVSLSNNTGLIQPAVIWSDFRTIPAFGAEGQLMPTDECSLATYVTAEGYLSVWTNGGWLVCSQDVFGVAVNAFAPGAYAEVTFYQNFTSHVAAVMVNDRVVLQDYAMPAAMTNYNKFVAANLDSSAYLDDVYIQTTYPAGRLSYNGNGDALADAAELQLYGYVARTLTVGPAGRFSTFGNALAVARDRDGLQVVGTSFAESIALGRNLTVFGVAFTNGSTVTLAESTTNVIQNNIVCSNMVVGTNAVATFTNLVSYSNLTIQAGATVVADTVTCSNLVVEPGARFICKGAFLCLGGSSFATNTTASFSNSMTCVGTVSVPEGASVYLGQGATVGSLALSGVLSVGAGYGIDAGLVDLSSGQALVFAAPLSCSNLVVWAGTTASVVNVTCTNVTVQSGASLQSQAALVCRSVLTATGSVTVAAGQSLSAASAIVPGLISVSSGATATVSSALSLPEAGRIDVTTGTLLYVPLSANMSGTFSLTNNWGQGDSIVVSSFANCVFNQPLTNPPLGTLTLATASTSTVRTVSCTNLVAETGAYVTLLDVARCFEGATFGQGAHLTSAGPLLVGSTLTLADNVVALFSNTVVCGNTLDVGAGSTVIFLGAVAATNGLTIDANASAAFNQPVFASNIVVRAGTVAIFDAMTCSNLVVEAGASLTVSSALMCGGTVSIASGASVSFLGDVSLGALVSAGNVTLTGGHPFVAGTMTVLGPLQANSSTVTVAALSVPVIGSGLITFTNGQLNVTGLGVTLSGTFTVDTSWGTQATVGLPFTDTFDLYTANMSLQALGFRGWGASTNTVLVKASEGEAGTQAALLPAVSILSNRIASAATRVWTDYRVRPVPGAEPVQVTTNGLAWHAYVNASGRLAVWTNGVWMVCSNYLDGTTIPVMSPATYVRITLFTDYTLRTSVLFLDGKIIQEAIPFAGGETVPSFSSLMVENMSGDSVYLDGVTISIDRPVDLTSDLDHDGIADSLEIQRFGSLTNPCGSIFTFR